MRKNNGKTKKCTKKLIIYTKKPIIYTKKPIIYTKNIEYLRLKCAFF